MKKITKTQICLILLAILNLCCLILFIISLIPIFENNLYTLKDAGVTKPLILNSIFSLIILLAYMLFMFMITNFVFYYINQRIKAKLSITQNIRFSPSLMFIFISIIIINLFSLIYQGFSIYLITLQHLSLWWQVMYFYVYLITTLFYIVLFSVLLHKELKLKKLSNSSSGN